MNVPERLICILGMHRSGTSCLTGSLQQAGLHLGQHFKRNPHNLKGNRENPGFVALNDAVLAANRGAWDFPPRHVSWSDVQLDRARALLDQHADHAVVGFKDPRTLLVLNGWRQLVPHMLRVGIFRHPNAVAQSLVVRSGGEMQWRQCLRLWYQYNRKLLAEYQRSAFPILCFDAPEEIFQSKVDAVSRELGLQPPDGEERFYSAELRSSDGSLATELPWKVNRLYQRLLRIAY
ncbi:MAG: sulfotransferase family protein [Pseudomonadota bacterium]